MYASNSAAIRYYAGEATPAPSFEDILALAEQGDRRAGEALDRMAHYLGVGMASLVTAIGPAVVMVVGEVSRAWKRVGPVVERVAAERALMGQAPRILALDDSRQPPVARDGGTADAETLRPTQRLYQQQKRGRVKSFRVDSVVVEIHPGKVELGRAAAARAAAAIRASRRPRLIIGTGPSQNEVWDALTVSTEIDWGRVEVFHMDEYVGLPATHPASFRRWLKERVADVVHPGAVHYLNGDAADLEAELRRYAALVGEAPVTVCFIGFGGERAHCLQRSARSRFQRSAGGQGCGNG